MIHAAASDAAKPGETITFPDAPAGEERAGLDHNEHWRMVKVPKESPGSVFGRILDSERECVCVCVHIYIYICMYENHT